jgi:hypothetical protein
MKYDEFKITINIVNYEVKKLSLVAARVSTVVYQIINS